VCNGCSKKSGCRLDKSYYRAATANRQYKTVLVESRNGINISEDDIKVLDSLISPLILQGQSPYLILQNHPEILLSEKTIYNYIESGVLSVKNIDLPKKVKYKVRSCHSSEIKDSGIFEGRTYKEFTSYLESYPDTNVVEMDTVFGCEGSRKVLLTFFFRNCHLMLAYLMDNKKPDSVKTIFDKLERNMTTPVFAQTFSVVLTDRGSEFSNPDSLECGEGGCIRTSIYYCDPMASWQKPGIEKNHVFIRKILPKGTSFDHLTQNDINKVMNHINSTARASLNGLHPLKLARLLIHKNAIHTFHMREVKNDTINLTPSLIK
jgi:IS30 family transposase